ncbi:hypothetical protein PRUPE_3G093300, partial [Prunus persica]
IHKLSLLGRVTEARQMFDIMPRRDSGSWNSMISGYIQNGLLNKAQELFDSFQGKNVRTWTILLSGYARHGRAHEARAVFESMPERNVVSWNAMITAYAQNGLLRSARDVFDQMPERNTVSWNSMITGYCHCGMMGEARELFDQMEERNIASWMVMVSGYVEIGECCDAWMVFLMMLRSSVRPDQAILVAALLAVMGFNKLELIESLRVMALKTGYESNVVVGTAFLNAYIANGNGLGIFLEMPDRDIVTWNAVLTGCAQNGLGKEAVEVFKQMETTGISPNETSFLALLCACSHAGLVDEGWAYFNSMSQHHGITPSVYHYTCMVDLLGRAGWLSEAEDLIRCMPVKPDSVIWEALLGACRIHRNTELGQRVAERLFQMGTKRSGTYVLLSNMYASRGMWGKVREIREMMTDRGVTKEPGISWIQIKNKVHYFLMGEKAHDEIKEINMAVNELYRCFRATGYVPDTNFVLHDVAEEQKEDDLLYHSEKLAVAYGILQTPNGAPIQILKNLRTCGDCHSFMKFVSSVAQRKIILRDGNRFHHFQDGLCSCGDYW